MSADSARLGAMREAARALVKTRPRRSAREEMFAAWVENLRPRSLDGNAVQLLQGGIEFFPALEQAIASAREEVLLETYLFEDDPSGRRIAAALAAAAQRGVRVHVTVDGFGCGQRQTNLQRLMQRAGVRVEVFRPEHRLFALTRQRLRRLHRKITVIDGRLAFVGGINILDDFYDPNHGPLDAPRLDFSTRLEGPIVRPVHYAAHRHWWSLSLVNRSLRRLGRPPDERYWSRVRLPEPVVPSTAPAGVVRAMFVLRDNFRFRHTIERRYLWAIRRARREILIANAYFFPGVRFRRALIAAARRGVRVRLLLQGRVEYRLQHYASQALYDELLAAGIEIIEYVPSFLHAKVAVIDDWATVGSSNIDPFSLLLAREANVVVADADFARTLLARLEVAIRDGGRPVHLHHVRRRSWPMRLVNWISFGLLRLGVTLSGVPGRY